MARKQKNFNLKAALITFGVIGGLVLAIFGLGAIPGACVAGVLGGALGGVMFSPLDTTTHNKQDVARMQAEQSKKVSLTGDKLADSMIVTGTNLLERMEKAEGTLTEAELISLSNSVREKSRQIIKEISDVPSKAPRIRKFINYYLPVASRILDNYSEMKTRGVTAAELEKAATSSVSGLGMIVQVCDKQLDRLHDENMMDIDTDLDVLQTMLVRDGYTDQLAQSAKEAITAAEAQMRNNDSPSLILPVTETAPSEEVPVLNINQTSPNE